ncbi:peroxidase family protein [Dactylosporangium darangshiense]|uniref:F5/8 type C domain-containing protein n=1 Tax=Dactylosporangium darangshiense TaxID=579108 RepID=A0ABP8DE41_9ACTN
MHPNPRRLPILVLVAALLAGVLVAGWSGPAHAAGTLLSRGRPAVASSLENAGTPASAAVDGNGGTRWSSAFGDPQWLRVDLGAPADLSQVVLTWQNSYATAFSIQVSDDAATWATVYSTTTGAGGTQTLTVHGTGRFVRMYGTARHTQFGYSLWEFAVYGTYARTGCAAADNARGRPATASSTEGAATPASAAVDGNPGTRWSSAFSDPQWIQVDLGVTRRLCLIVLNWQNSYASAFSIQTSATGTGGWTTVYSTTTGPGGLQVLPVGGTGRYVRVLGTARHTQYGYSLWDFEVYAAADAPILGAFEAESLDGYGNNPGAANRGQAGTVYRRVGAARYADGKSRPVSGPNARAVSNRIFNDTNVNVFSERGVTQWGNVWGQFIDHTIGLRDEDGEAADIPFDPADPLESFTDDLGVIPFSRTAAAPGTGVTNARQQVNTVSSYIDAWAVYGGTQQRLDWLRDGPALFLPGGYLPRADSRGNAGTAPAMQVDGRLLAVPGRAVVAGDVRANENIALTAVQTLFAREHNRIVSLLPATMSAQDKFAIARAVVIAEQQYVTYNEFLPAMGVALPAYAGYNAGVDASVSNEFATVGYRAHSQIHGEIEVEADAGRYSAATLDALRAQGAEIAAGAGEVTVAIPLNVAFFNPDLVPMLQLGPLLEAIGSESEYRNDELIDNQLRSVLFQVPVSGNPECLDGPGLPECFDGVVDLGAIDLQRGRDHGMPSYNQLRAAYGLPAKTSFTAITGEATDAFPADPLLTPGHEIDDPNSLDIVSLFDINGNPTTVANDDATRVVRRTTLAARLKATYGSVDNLDAFTGMLAEAHTSGTELGELQRAIWAEQFAALRDGDRFFYDGDPLLPYLLDHYGIDYRHTLGQLIALNTDVPAAELPASVFRLH